MGSSQREAVETAPFFALATPAGVLDGSYNYDVVLAGCSSFVAVK